MRQHHRQDPASPNLLLWFACCGLLSIHSLLDRPNPTQPVGIMHPLVLGERRTTHFLMLKFLTNRGLQLQQYKALVR